MTNYVCMDASTNHSLMTRYPCNAEYDKLSLFVKFKLYGKLNSPQTFKMTGFETLNACWVIIGIIALYATLTHHVLKIFISFIFFFFAE